MILRNPGRNWYSLIVNGYMKCEFPKDEVSDTPWTTWILQISPVVWGAYSLGDCSVSVQTHSTTGHDIGCCLARSVFHTGWHVGYTLQDSTICTSWKIFHSRLISREHGNWHTRAQGFSEMQQTTSLHTCHSPSCQHSSEHKPWIIDSFSSPPHRLQNF